MPGWKTITKICDPVGSNPCDFADFMTLIKNGIVDLVLISTLIVVFMLVYAGYLLLTSQGNVSAYTKVKDIFWKVVWGYVIVLAAWLIVYTITGALLNSNANFLLGGGQP